MKELIKKYDVKGPRYTSYPALPFWKGPPTEENWIENLKKYSNEGIDLYVHIPFCKSLCYYCGCNRTITKSLSAGKEYLSYLLKEWDLYKNYLGELPIKSLHLGGGTPTFLTPKELDQLLDHLSPNFEKDFIGAIEIDPRSCKEDHINILRDYNFKRVSLGIQDFDPEVQTIINRIQSFELVEKLVSQLRAKGITSLNFDLIYGLPGQHEKSLSKTMELCFKLYPDLFAFYSYAHLPDKIKNQKLIKEDYLRPASEKLNLYILGRELFSKGDYFDIGLDHFAKKNSYLFKAFQGKKLKRSFMGYTDIKSPLTLGIGASSISNTPEKYTQNTKEVKDYFNRLDQKQLPIFHGHDLTRGEQELSGVIQELFCQRVLPVFSKEDPFFQTMEKEGLISFEQEPQVTTEGAPFMRLMATRLDPMMKKNQNMFSKII